MTSVVILYRDSMFQTPSTRYGILLDPREIPERLRVVHRYQVENLAKIREMVGIANSYHGNDDGIKKLIEEATGLK